MTAPRTKATPEDVWRRALLRATTLAPGTFTASTAATGTLPPTSTQPAGPPLREFIARVQPDFHFCEMHDLLIEHLEAVEAGKIKRLMLFMPPRHGKTILASTLFPAWYLGRNPRKQLITTSYNAEFSQKTISANTRSVFASEQWPYPHVQIDRSARSLKAWRTNAGGFAVYTGIGGPITGRGADLAIMDDVVKNRQEADSEVIRETHWQWYVSTLRTRLMPGGAIIFANTRWHDDDLSGRLLAAMDKGGEQWTVVRLPAVAEVDDLLGREPGRELCPHRWPMEELQAIRTSDPEEGGERNWAALYQQRPTPAEGGMFKLAWMDVRYDTVPDRLTKVVTVDAAYKEGVANDYSAIQVLGVKKNAYYVLYAWRGRVEFPGLLAQIARVCEQFGTKTVLIEDSSAGGPAIQMLKAKGQYRVVPVTARGTKEGRAEATTMLWEMGQVHLPREAPWLPDFIDEHLRFPAGKHDDQVDACAQALRWLSKGYAWANRDRRLRVQVK